MIYNKQTPNELLSYLVDISKEMTTKLTIEMVRVILGGLDNKIGTKGFELLIPELRFTKFYYKNTPYIKITPRKDMLRTNIERIGDGN